MSPLLTKKTLKFSKTEAYFFETINTEKVIKILAGNH